jgi:integrase
MTKLHLRYVQAYRGYHYFRRAGMPRIPLPGLVGSPEFMAAYQLALAAAPLPVGASTRSKPGSISAAIAEYYGSRAFKSFSGATPAQRRSVLERFREQHGHMPLASLPKEFLVTLFDTMAPHTARTTLKALRHFVGWGVERKLMTDNPTLGIRLTVPTTDGFHTWDEHEIAQFEAAHPIGSKARLAFALGLYTAQRRADVIRIGRQHIRGGVLSVRQQKTGTTLQIPVHAELQRIIDATAIGHLTLLTTRNSKSYGKNVFSDQFRRWCDAADLPEHCGFHGLRKAACRRLAEAGCSVNVIAAISGHKTLKEIERYTKAADQAKLARAGIEHIGTGSVENVPVEVSKALKSLPKKTG